MQYISKYASKAEPQSKAFSEIFSQILNNSELNESSLMPIQKLLLNSVAERDISAQKTYYLLLSILFYHSNHTFVSLNINDEVSRWIGSTGNGDNFIIIKDAGCTTRSALEKYWNRPNELEEFSLFKLYLTYKNVNDK